jgi:hypothetical protein
MIGYDGFQRLTALSEGHLSRQCSKMHRIFDFHRGVYDPKNARVKFSLPIFTWQPGAVSCKDGFLLVKS